MCRWFRCLIKLKKFLGLQNCRESKEKMMRTRLLWFTLGFTSASATMTHFIFKDLWADRLSLSSQLKEQFGVLGTRVSNLESAFHDIPNTHQDEGN